MAGMGVFMPGRLVVTGMFVTGMLVAGVSVIRMDAGSRLLPVARGSLRIVT